MGAWQRTVRAAMLAAIVVLSMSAAGFGVASAEAAPGTATGQDSTATGQATDNPRTISVDELQDERIWRGQEVQITGLEAYAQYDLRRTTGPDSSTFVRELTTDGDGAVLVDTRHLQTDEYFLRGGDYDRDGTLFEVSDQRLTASWSEPDVNVDESAALELDANRNDFQVEVSADGLGFKTLERIFDDEDFAFDYDTHREDDVIVLDAGDGAELQATFSGVSEGTYDFDVNVPDSTASDTATIRIGQRRADAALVRSQIEEDAGDVAEFTVRLKNTDRAYVVVGGDEAGFLDVVRVSDRTGDGTVTVRMNTRYAGLDPRDPGVPADVDVYSSEPGDNVYVGGSEDRVTAYDGDDRLATGQTLDHLRHDLDVDRGLERPLRAGEYSVSVATSDDVRERRGSVDVIDERSTGTLSLDDPSLEGVTAGVAPPDGVGSTTAAEVRDATTERKQVALGDRAVFRFDVSGMYGHLEAEHHASASGLIDNADEGIDLVLRRTTPEPDPDEDTVDVTHRSVDVHVDDANDEVVVVLDTRTLQRVHDVAAGQEYRATLTLAAVAQDSAYDVRSTTAANHQGYPYLEPGQSATASTTVELVEPRVQFDGVHDDRLEVRPAPDVRVSGTTNVAPGSELQVRHLASGQNPFQRGSTVTVQTDGSWEATADFSVGALDQRFTTSVRRADETIGAVESVFVAEVSDPDSTPDPDSERTPTPGDDSRSEFDPQPEPQPESESESEAASLTERLLYGFGSLLVVLGLIGGILLLLRRR